MASHGSPATAARRIRRHELGRPALVPRGHDGDLAPELAELEDLRFDPRVNDAHLAFLATT